MAVTHHAALDELATAYLGRRDEFDQINRVELARRLHDGDTLVVDVRREAEYGAGHIAGAVSIPQGHLLKAHTKGAFHGSR